jgi:hypothetical protein
MEEHPWDWAWYRGLGKTFLPFDKEELELLCSGDYRAQVALAGAIVSLYSAINLDDMPVTMTRNELVRKYNPSVCAYYRKQRKAG